MRPPPALRVLQPSPWPRRLRRQLSLAAQPLPATATVAAAGERAKIGIRRGVGGQRFLHSQFGPVSNTEVGITTQLAHTVLDNVHNFTGLSWLLIIPMVSLVGRICLSVPALYAIFRQQRATKQREPLQEAFRNICAAMTSPSAKQSWMWIDTYHPSHRRGRPCLPRKPMMRIKQLRGSFPFLSQPKLQKFTPLLLFSYLPVWHGCMTALFQMSTSPSAGTSTTISSTSTNPEIMFGGLSWLQRVNFDPTCPDPSLLFCLVYSCLTSFNVLNAYLSKQRLSPAHLLPLPPSKEQHRPTLLFGLYLPVSMLCAVASGGVLYLIQAPAAVALFACSSSLWALLLRTAVRWRVLGGGNKAGRIAGRSGGGDTMVFPPQRRQVRPKIALLPDPGKGRKHIYYLPRRKGWRQTCEEWYRDTL